MALEKGFLKNREGLYEISRRTWILGGIIWLVLAICFFNFLNFLQFYVIAFDSMRNDFEPYFLSGTAKFYYHFILGAVSVHFAYSLVYRYFLDKPKKLSQRKIYKRQTSVNNVRMFNWYFLHWFFEVGFILTFFLPLVKGVEFYPEYTYFVWLIVLVLFGKIWMSVRPIVKRRLIWFMASGLIFLGSSYTIPKINFTNPERLQTELLGNNLMYQNNIHLVSSDVFEGRHYYPNYSSDILIPNRIDSIIYFDAYQIKESELEENIYRTRERKSD